VKSTLNFESPACHSPSLYRRWLSQAVAMVMCAAVSLSTAAHSQHDHSNHAAPAGVSRSEMSVSVPSVNVLRADGKRMTLSEAIEDGRPVMLNFIFTSCNAICPVTSMVFVEFREKLGAARDQINMVSISIDPEQDTPRRLTAYAKRFGSAGTWPHFTSSSADSAEIQRAFGSWRGDKMNHQPITYLRSAPGRPWIRIDGFAPPEVLVREVQGFRLDKTAAR